MRAVLGAIVILLGCLVLGWCMMIRMPGHSFAQIAQPLSEQEVRLREELAADVRVLAGDIGERNLANYAQLQAAADHVERSFTGAGLHVRRDGYDLNGNKCDNIEVEIPGRSAEIVLVGAHYDSVLGSPGANDNGSGVAAMLALARRFAGTNNARTLRFVGFVNEEPPYFLGGEMGSLVYARRCKERGDRIRAMISLETIGYFSDAPQSQHYPLPGLKLFYPVRGNFIGFVSNVSSQRLLRQTIRCFRAHATIASQGAALPAGVPGVGWSDHRSFWKCGYPAMMVTDTALFRYPHYHSLSDTPDKLDYNGLARVVSAMAAVVRDLADSR